MLVEFSVENFRSIAKNQTLKMTASGGTSQDERFFETHNSIVPNVYATSCILGPNASGKTNFIAAIAFFRYFVKNSSTEFTLGDEIPIVPNILIGKFRKKPSVFEIIFVVNGSVYQYGFSVIQEMVLEEWMYWKSNDSKSKMKKIFERRFNKSNSNYSWEFKDESLNEDRKLWIKHTRNNALFLSTSVQLNSKTLEKPANWLSNELRCIYRLDKLKSNFTLNYLSKNKKKILNLLNSFDLQIENINIERSNKKVPDEAGKIFKERFIERIQKIQLDKVEFIHKTDNSTLMPIDLHEESDGTISLFSLAGPLLDVLENGYTLIADELQNSLHPLALKYIVNLFQNKETNKKNAQLIFTTHTSSIMAFDFLLQEQIWLMEREKKHESKLYPLSKYKLTGDEDLQTFYLHGLFGATPNLGGKEEV